MTNKDLSGKTAVVTGSAGGIGLDVAKALAARGANVMLSDIQPADKVQPVCDALMRDDGVKVGYQSCNVADYAQIEVLMQKTAALSDTGAIDIVVNNAGIQHKANFAEFPVDKWNQIIGINLSGVFYGMRAAVPYLDKSKDGGRIFNIASVNGHVGSPEKAAYCAAKAAVVNLTRVAGVDLKEKHIASFSISPGFLDTPLARKQVQDFMANDGLNEQQAIEKLLEFQKIKEFIPVEYVSHIVCNVSALPCDKALELSGRDMLIDNGWRDKVYEQHPPQMSEPLIKQFTQSLTQKAA